MYVRIELLAVHKLEVAVRTLAGARIGIIRQFLGNVVEEACPLGSRPNLGHIVRGKRCGVACDHDQTGLRDRVKIDKRCRRVKGQVICRGLHRQPTCLDNATHVFFAPDLDDFAVGAHDPAEILLRPTATKPIHNLDGLTVPLVLDCKRFRRAEIVQQRVTRSRTYSERQSIRWVTLQSTNPKRVGCIEGCAGE